MMMVVVMVVMVMMVVMMMVVVDGDDGGDDGGDGGWCLNYLKKIKRLHFIIFFQIVVSRISRNLLGRWDHSDQSIYARR
jgi:hypothetical protein